MPTSSGGTKSSAGRCRAALLTLLCVLFPVAPAFGVQPSPAATSTPMPVERLQIPFPQDDGSLTPYTFELGYSLMTLIYDTLMWRDKDGIPQPWLASSVTTSPDGRKIGIKLREQLVWQDDEPLTSSDVAFTFRYMASHPHPRFSAQLEAVESVETPDPLSAEIALSSPSPGFLDQPLSDIPILPAHLWEALPAGQGAPEGLPVGSGPYRLVRYLEEDSYRFQANETYFLGPPAAKIIDVPFINDAGRMFGAFELGRADMIPVSLPADIIRRLEGIGTGIARGPTYLGTVLMLNLRRPPFDDPQVRQRVARAVDLERISQAVGFADPARKGYLHPESRFAPQADVPPGGGSIAGSRDLSGLSFEVLAPDNDPVKIEAGRQTAQALRRAGADVESTRISRQELSSAVGEDGSSPTFQAAIWSSSPLASYDPDFPRRVFGSDPQTGTFNLSGYRSPGFDALATRIATTTDPVARQTAINEAVSVLATDAPVVPLFFSRGAFAFRERSYDGWLFVKGTGILDKQSFFGRQGAGRRAPPGPRAPADAPPQEAPGGFPFGLVAIGFLLAAAAIGGVAVIRNRS